MHIYQYFCQWFKSLTCATSTHHSGDDGPRGGCSAYNKQNRRESNIFSTRDFGSTVATGKARET